ncbi:MAG: hypothetical protein H0W02_23560 [Ktedonobacteraceae bacterium]|nr:hypothetical protein [Ktedonobacteraceae bacterium]
MAANSVTKARSGFSVGSLAWWAAGILCFTFLAFVIINIIIQFTSPGRAPALQLVQDIPLPGALPPPGNIDPLQPALSYRFDHFDFQSYDPRTGLLFMAHTGPNPDKVHTVDHNVTLDPATDGNVLVFNTRLNQIVKRIEIPQASGVIIAPDLRKVYVAAGNDDLVFVINELTFQILKKINVDTQKCSAIPCEGPDAMAYDPVEHKIFVSNPGTDLPFQNVSAINAFTDTLITNIPLGFDKAGGDDIGHNRYDPISHRDFVIMQPLPVDANALPQPPSYMAVIDAIRNRFITRVRLPDSCVDPHGFTVDPQQRMGFIACISSNRLQRVNLDTLRFFSDGDQAIVLPKPDIVVFDQTSHLILIGCQFGVSVLDERNGSLRKLGDFFVGKGSHTLVVDEATHTIYLPIANVGGRPVLRVEHYDPNGLLALEH